MAHAYIFSGPEDVGKTTIAYCLAKNLMLSDSNSASDIAHLAPEKLALSGDVSVLEKDSTKKNISVNQIREFIDFLSHGSFNNSYKVGIIKEAELLSSEAANSLLKILEEPPQKTIIILLTANIDHLLPTLVSRSQLINFYPVKSEVIYEHLTNDYGAPPSLAKNLAALASGRPALAIKFLEQAEIFESYQTRAATLLEFFDESLIKRFAILNKMLSATEAEETSAVDNAAKILDIWEGVSRDLLLINYGHNDLLQFPTLKDKLKAVAERHSLLNLRQLNALITAGRKYLAANVSPKNVLENIVLNF